MSDDKRGSRGRGVARSSPAFNALTKTLKLNQPSKPGENKDSTKEETHLPQTHNLKIEPSTSEPKRKPKSTDNHNSYNENKPKSSNNYNSYSENRWKKTYGRADLENFFRGNGKRISRRDIVESLKSSNSTSDSNWEEIIDDWIIDAAIEKGAFFIDLAVEIFCSLIGDLALQEAAYTCILRRTGDVMRIEAAEFGFREENFCKLLGRLAVGNWSRQYNSPVKEINMVLFATISVLQGWLDVLIQNENHDPETIAICSEALVGVFLAAGRPMWLQYPDTVDLAYNALKKILVGQNKVEATSKAKLLELYVEIVGWTKPSKKPALVSVKIQTD